MLEEYVGLDKKQIAHMKKEHSRSCTIFKNYPQCYGVAHEIGLLNIHDDDSCQDEKLVKAKRKHGQQQQEEEEEERKSPPAVV